MKKTLISILAVAALFAGCSKDALVEKTTSEDIVVPANSFICSFAANEQNGTKTTIHDDGTEYLIKWEKGDVITVTNDDWETTKTFTADYAGSTVSFSADDVENFFGAGKTYKAKFGSNPSATEFTVKSGSVSHIYMEDQTGCDDESRTFTFTTGKTFFAVTIPDGVSAKGLKVMNGTNTVATLSSDEAIKVFYVPLTAGSVKYEICAYTDQACTSEIAESMKMYGSHSAAVETIYPFTFTPTLKITGKGDYTLKSYSGDYKVWICNAEQSGGITVSGSDAITIGYTDASEHPANVYVDGKNSSVANLTITTPDSHVELESGISANVTSKTSNATLVVKPSYTITTATVKEGSITVEGKEDDTNIVRNVDNVVLAYESQDKMTGTVVSVAKVTYGDPVVITNNTTNTGNTPITVVGKDNSGKSSTTDGGYKITDNKTQNITKVESAVAKIGDKVYSTLADAFENVQEGQTITLTDDCETGASYDVKNMLAMTVDNVTIDLNGKTITETNKFSFAIAGNNAVVKNGYVKSGADAGKTCGYHSYAMVIAAVDKDAKITGVQIQDVVFTGGVSIGGSTDAGDESYVCQGSAEATFERCSVTSGNYYVMYSQPTQSVATVLSGSYDRCASYTGDPFAAQGSCKIVLKGGTYNFDPTANVADGYSVVGPVDERWTIEPNAGVVATIGDKEFSTLAEAITAANESQDSELEIDLVQDCETGSEYNLGSNMLALTKANVTLDLNGHTITETNNFSWVIAGNNDIVKNGSIVSGYNGGKTCRYHSYALVIGGKTLNDNVTGVKIQNIVFKGGLSVGGSKTNNEADYQGSAEVELSNCDITSGDCYAIYVQPKEAVTKSCVTVLSGKYTHYTGLSSSHVFDLEAGCSAVLKGGIYSETPASGYVAEDYAVTDNTDAATKALYPKKVAAAVASIGSNYYATLTEAFSAVQDGETITLQQDCETGSQYTETNMLALTKANVTLDLKGHTITETNNFSWVIAGNNDIVKDGSIVSGSNDAKTCKYHSYALAIGAKGENDVVTGIKIQNVQFTGGLSVGGSIEGNTADYQGSAESTEIENCTVQGGDWYAICVQSHSSSVTVKSGTYNHSTAGSTYATVFSKESGCTISLTGGTYSKDPSSYVASGYEAVKNGETWTVQPSILLPGKFSVSADKKVNFTKGNLYYSSTDSKYHIESQQNVTYTTLNLTDYDITHVTLFWWANPTESTTEGKEPWRFSFTYGTHSTSDAMWCGVDSPLTVDGQSNLYALTKDEWEYLLNTRTNASSLYRYEVSVTTSAGTTEKCFVIAPDGYEGTIADSYTPTDWATAEAAGLVCLPNGGGYKNGKFDYPSYCHYWTASPCSMDYKQHYAYLVKFEDVSVVYTNRNDHCSVRLVADAN